jgi:AraC-like DNA-binding protein
LFSYFNYKDILDKELNQPQTEMLQINLDITNRSFRDADEQAVRASFHPNTLSFIQAAPQSKQEKAAILYSYLNTIAFHKDIHSIYIVDLKNKQLVTSVSDQSYEWMKYPDQSWIPWTDTMKTKPLLIKRRTLEQSDNTKKEEVISLFRPILLDQELVGLVIVNVDYDRLFSEIYTQIKVPYYIYNLEGELIYPKLDMQVPVSEMQKAIEVLGIRPFGEVKLEGQSYLANQAFSDMTGWRWVSLIQLDQLLKNVRLVRNIVFLLSLLSILIGCSAIYYYNYASFRQVNRIRRLISRNEQVPSQTDLYDLEHLVTKLLKEFDVKSSVAEQSLPELRSKYIQDVLFRRIGSKEQLMKWEGYFEQWTDEPLMVVVISINRYIKWSTAFSEEDELLLKYALTNIVMELLEPEWFATIVPLDKENMALIIQSKEIGRINLELKAQEVFDGMAKPVRNYLNILISVGIGNPCSSVTEIHRSFAEASTAVSYRLYEGYEKTIRFSEVDSMDTPIVFESEPWKAEMIKAYETGDAEVCRQAIQRWVDYLYEKRYLPDSVYSFADDLIDDYSSILAANGIPKPSVLDDYTEHQLKMMDLADVKQLLLDVTEALMKGINRHKSTKEYQLVQRMIRFMEEHMHEQIGLQEIAEFAGLSTSSISSMFKQETNHSVYEYLTKMRIDQACKLLSETDLKIASIASQVGYQNENSFIRSFRKLRMVTPGKYRELHTDTE